MLTTAELKITMTTLGVRRSWLRKQLENPKLDESQREEYTEAARLIDSSLKKLGRMVDDSLGLAEGAARGPRKHKLLRALVAEDNEESATMIAELLTELGIQEVDTARDGMDAFDKIKSASEPYSLIFCDWDMPLLNGLQVYTKAKASNTLRGAHFMMVTAVSEAARIREAIQVGIDDYLVKPIDIEILEGKIRAALGDLMPKDKQTS